MTSSAWRYARHATEPQTPPPDAAPFLSQHTPRPLLPPCVFLVGLEIGHLSTRTRHLVTWGGDDPFHRVISKNLRRRQLTDDQRLAIVQKAGPKLEAEIKAEANRKRAEAARKRPRNADGNSFSQSEVKSPRTVDLPPPTVANPLRRTMAEMAGVPENKVKAIRAVAKAKPEVIDEIVAGKKSLRGSPCPVRGETSTDW